MIEDERWYSNTLINIAEQLPNKEKQLILRQAIEVVKSNYCHSIILLNVMTQQLWDEEKQVTIQQFLELAKTINYDFRFDMIMFYFLTEVIEPLQGKEKQVVLQQTVEIIKERYGIDEIIIDQLQTESTLQKACFDNALKLCLSLRKYPNIGYSNFKICFKITIARLQDLNPNLLTYDLWKNCLEPLFPNRLELFEIIGEFCTAAIQLTGNPQEANEIARAVMDVVRWWP